MVELFLVQRFKRHRILQATRCRMTSYFVVVSVSVAQFFVGITIAFADMAWGQRVLSVIASLNRGINGIISAHQLRTSFFAYQRLAVCQIRQTLNATLRFPKDMFCGSSVESTKLSSQCYHMFSLRCLNSRNIQGKMGILWQTLDFWVTDFGPYPSRSDLHGAG